MSPALVPLIVFFAIVLCLIAPALADQAFTFMPFIFAAIKWIVVLVIGGGILNAVFSRPERGGDGLSADDVPQQEQSARPRPQPQSARRSHPGFERPSTSSYSGSFENSNDPLGGSATFVNPKMARVDTKKGTSFYVTDRGSGQFYAQQIDPDTGRNIGLPFQGDGKVVSKWIKHRR